jgi:hypothetical protein
MDLFSNPHGEILATLQDINNIFGPNQLDDEPLLVIIGACDRDDCYVDICHLHEMQFNNKRLVIWSYFKIYNNETSYRWIYYEQDKGAITEFIKLHGNHRRISYSSM